MEKEEIVAMACALIAEDMSKDIKDIKVISFREVKPSYLDEYIHSHPEYTKYIPEISV